INMDLTQLRTKSEQVKGNLSEPKATSDKINGSRRTFVRTRGNFGQNRRKPPDFCLNPEQLRTKSAEAAGLLSELQATSDKIRGNRRTFV
ncbi:hypothetical protein J7E35_19020, partial [Bacillus sp. ISL-45]|nr:hypothetical protein [Bacillus sp. ISL-45]